MKHWVRLWAEISKDLVECRLADDGSGTVTWRVNGKEAVRRQTDQTDQIGSINHDGVSRCAFCIFFHQRSICLFCHVLPMLLVRAGGFSRLLKYWSQCVSYGGCLEQTAWTTWTAFISFMLQLSSIQTASICCRCPGPLVLQKLESEPCGST